MDRTNWKSYNQGQKQLKYLFKTRAFINNFIPLILTKKISNTITPPPPPTPESKVKERLKGLKYSIGFGVSGGGTQRKGTGMSTIEKEAILQKCLNTFIPHCLNAKLCYCTQVKSCMTMIIVNWNYRNQWHTCNYVNIYVIMLLVVTPTQMISPQPDRVSEMPVGVQVITYTSYILLYVS